MRFARTVAAALAASVLTLSATASAVLPPAPGALSPQTLKLPDGPASVRGLADTPSVSAFSGQVSYSLPIDLPSAVNGFRPALSLTYSGALGNGPMGIGWAIGELSIRRSVRMGVPTFTDADELEIHGIAEGRLVLIPDGTYRVEGQSNEIKIVKQGAGFIVTTPDGVTYALGQTSQGRQDDPSGAHVTAWLTESITDLTKQTATFGYWHDQGQVYLSSITWGPGAPAAFRVSLAYQPRTDAVSSYREGFSVTTGQRLQSVEVDSFGEVLRTYALTYDDTLPLSRLAKVHMSGRGGKGAMPDLNLTYGAPAANPATVRLAKTDGWVLNQRSVSLLDFDGDGLSDFVRAELGAHSYLRNLGDGTFSDPIRINGADSTELARLRFVDLDGDAVPELVFGVLDTWRAQKLVGGVWQTATILRGSKGIPIYDPTTFVLDVNGDGKTDVMRAVTLGFELHFGDGVSFGPGIQVPAIHSADPAVTPTNPNVRARDVNGDGLTDYVWLNDGWFKVYLGSGDGHFVEFARANYPWPDTTLDGPNTQLADLNRDGVMDLVRFSSGNVAYYRGHPNLTFDAPITLAKPEAVDGDVVTVITDIDGNGSEDIVWSSTRGNWSLDLAGITTAGMLTKLDNGLGKTISLEYQASSQLSAAAQAKGTPWSRLLPVSIPIPVRMVTSTGPDEPARATKLEVRDGFWDGIERRFGGFLTSREHPDTAIAATTETTFEEGQGSRRVLRGMPLTTRTIDDKGQVVLVHHYTRDTLALAGLGASPLARHPILLDESEDHSEGLTQARTTRTEYSYDDQGRVIETRKLGLIDTTGDEATHFTTYASDDTTWVRDKVITEGTKDASGAILRESRSFYGDDTTVLALGAVGKGWTRRTESRLVDSAGNEAWRTDKAFTYDARGLTIAELDGPTLHSRVYDDSGLFVVDEHVTTGGRPITWTATWDRVQGLPTSMTDPNGSTTYDAYDGLGRLVSRAHTQGKPYVTYDYDWTAPRPKTTTHLFEADESTLTPFTGWQPGSGWRESVEITTGAGEHLYTATRLASDRLTVDQWTVRDDRGKIVFRGEPFEYAGTDLPAAPPADLPGERLTYDALGRTAKNVLANGAARSSAFSAFAITTTLDGLAPVTTLLDGLGRITHTERVIHGASETVDAQYDATSAITALRLQGGLVQHAYTYDSLGRIVGTRDPDSGARTLRYDAFDQLVEQINGAGQSVQYTYDDIGRVTTTHTADGRSFVYHYDVEKDGTSKGRTLGHVAWIEEPTGEVHFTYDRDGRIASTRRSVKGRSLEEDLTYAACGTLLHAAYDDGFGFDIRYDDAGRPIQVGDFWQALKLDARGAVVQGRFGNGVTESFERDAIGQPSHLRIERTPGAAIYDVTVQRSPFGAIASVQDGDGVGLDHSATFAYDDAGRVTQATIGGAARQFAFAYAYDGLQNMIARSAAGPKALGIFSGTYVYGESGKSPRQLTRVHDGASDVTMDYDAAGRMTRQGDMSLVYNEFDELVQALDATSAPKATHDYGYDGLRTWTKNADGTEQVWLASDVTEKDGRREHLVAIGGRTVAKVSMAVSDLPAPATGSISDRESSARTITPSTLRASFAIALSALFVAAFAAIARISRRTARRGSPAFAFVGLVAILAACSTSSRERSDRTESAASTWASQDRVYFHQGFAAGPVIFTRADGSIEEERTYEPFGAPLDAYREGGGVSSVGDVDFKRESRNVLDNETDPNTQLAYQGARWMAPQLARWLTPDPPTKAPDPKFLVAPWDLNPYAFARSSPLLFWDPDGQSWKSFAKGFIIGAVTAVATTVAIAAVAAVAPVAATVIGGAMLAKGAYDLYKGRHELAAMGHRIVSGTTTDADHEAFGNMLGSFVGGKVGGRLAGKLIKVPPRESPSAPREQAPSCSGGKCTVPGNCFIAGTLVATALGLVPIEQVHPGDRVLSRNDETGEVAYREVEEAFVRHTDALEEIDLAADDGHAEHITTTPEHPVWIDGKGWTPAHDLRIGDQAIAASGAHLVVVDLRERGADVEVYNFRVADWHTYFVGESNVWVHNECGGKLPYAELEDHPSVGSGKNFTQAQKRNILAKNRERNGGVLRDDRTGELLETPQKHMKGVTPPANEAQVDHVYPRAEGGPNSYLNAEVRGAAANNLKSNKIE